MDAGRPGRTEDTRPADGPPPTRGGHESFPGSPGYGPHQNATGTPKTSPQKGRRHSTRTVTPRGERKDLIWGNQDRTLKVQDSVT